MFVHVDARNQYGWLWWLGVVGVGVVGVGVGVGLGVGLGLGSIGFVVIVVIVVARPGAWSLQNMHSETHGTQH
jgi:uncharacterized membrane-anchored protein